MIDVPSKSISDLEEMLEAEIPCGGIKTGGPQPCPNQAAAVWVSSGCDCPPLPASFKCHRCWREWAERVMARSGFGICMRCGKRIPMLDCYRPL